MQAFGVVTGVLVLTVVACGSSSSDGGGQTTNQSNPCATKGATYLQHMVENPTGTCGPVPDSITNISSDGTGPAITCDSIGQDGCRAHDSGCVVSNNGVTCTLDTDITFQADGSSATGLISESCTMGSSSCTSTYGVNLTRQ